jgi:DNA-binding MarR family transcriptional regulator
MISSGGLSDRLDRLAKAGLISRPAAAGDGRSLPVQLTPLGRQRAEQAFRQDMKVEAELLEGLTSRERDAMAALLRKLATRVAKRIEQDDANRAPL